MCGQIRQIDIARCAGVHATTVSLALSDRPGLTLPTRTRIRELAKELGYTPHPALNALTKYRKSKNGTSDYNTIAYFTYWDSPWAWKENHKHSNYYKGLKRGLARAGFKVEHFWLGDDASRPREFCRQLSNRGIVGVVAPSHRTAAERLQEFDWTPFAGVVIGASPQIRGLPRVTEDSTAMLRQVIRYAIDEGRDRVGFVIPVVDEEMTDGEWSSGFNAELARQGRSSSIPIHYYYNRDPEMGAEELKLWLSTWSPDCIISFCPALRAVLSAIHFRGEVKFDYIDLFGNETDVQTAGFVDNSESVGEVAADLLVKSIERGRLGLQPYTTSTLVMARWAEVASVR